MPSLHKAIFPPVDADAGVPQTDTNSNDADTTTGTDSDDELLGEDGLPLKPKSMKEKIGFRERKVHYGTRLEQ